MRPFAAILVVAISAALLASCSRDPWDSLKPHQMLAKANELFEQESPQAGRAAQLAFDKAVRAELDRASLREYARVLFQHHALAGELAKAETVFERVHPPAEHVYVYAPVANNLAVLYHRAGRREDALRIARKTIVSLDNTSSMDPRDTRGERAAILANMDRIATAYGDMEAASAAYRILLDYLLDLTQSRYGRAIPLDPGLRDWLDRYALFLRGQGREAKAMRVEGIVQASEARAPSPPDVPRCVTQSTPQRLTCVLDAG